ncbi:MAG: aldose 1-epimerase family protein [Oscillospiraceae bacterium]|jgi:galactose mutarotase-like enzyme|nr:aldose 1-epimerase family protein [Oscillospiraceae bacterium]
MLYHIENDRLFCAVDDRGAQLHSIKDRESGTEYLWQGDPAVWDGRAPVLFPIVGRLKDDRYRWRGKEYTLPKHGFARESRFRLLQREGARVAFALESDDGTRARYPFEFALALAYRLEGRALIAEATVSNRGDGEMYFSIGAHPGFNCAMGDVLRFGEPETLASLWIDGEAMLAGGSYPVLENSTDIAIHERLFDRDALILKGVKSKHVTLVRGGKPCVKFDIGGAPVLGIWAKPGAAYVCVEPWFGLNDSGEFTPEFSQKPLIQRLGPGAAFTQYWKAEFLS